MSQLKSILTEGKGKGHSLVVMTTNGDTLTFEGRGVADLYELYTKTPSVLNGAIVADRVTGVGAAALMALGGVKTYYSGVISKDALAVLNNSGIEGQHDILVEYIINRSGNGRCPLELLLVGKSTPQEMLPIIHDFMVSSNQSRYCDRR